MCMNLNLLYIYIYVYIYIYIIFWPYLSIYRCVLLYRDKSNKRKRRRNKRTLFSFTHIL